MFMKKNRNLVTGIFVGHERGFGFLEVEGREDDIFIPPNSTGPAMNGDVVSVEIVSEKVEETRRPLLELI